MPTFKERFLFLKAEKDVSLETIALSINSNKGSLSMMVNGRLNVKKDTLEDLSRYFDVDVAYLIGESDIRRKDQDDIINNAYIKIARSAREKGISVEKLQRIIDAL